LTTKTSKYRLDVSQLSLQCYPSFLLSLLSKKSRHIFSEIFGKFIFFVWGRNLTKTFLQSFCLFRASFCQQLFSEFWLESYLMWSIRAHLTILLSKWNCEVEFRPIRERNFFEFKKISRKILELWKILNQKYFFVVHLKWYIERSEFARTAYSRSLIGAFQ
jgi:hypothetical protein